MVGYWTDTTVCSVPKWQVMPTLTFDNVHNQCSSCQSSQSPDYKPWKRDLYFPPCSQPPCVQAAARDVENMDVCPCRFSGPLL